MNIPPPEKRVCQKCFNSMALNLFKLNSSECRYCQDGLEIPKIILSQNKPIVDSVSIVEDLSTTAIPDETTTNIAPKENISIDEIDLSDNIKQDLITNDLNTD